MIYGTNIGEICATFGTYMVKFHEDAYWPKNLSLFAISCEHYRGPKNKIMRKSGIHSSARCRDSTLEQFLFYRVSRKMQKAISFGAAAIAQYIYQNNN